jgi:D-arginine dehydrogenase
LGRYVRKLSLSQFNFEILHFRKNAGLVAEPAQVGAKNSQKVPPMIYDFIVIGAGMAGASAAFELAKGATVLLIEAEAQPGYHSTGRSAALFTRNYGTPLVRRINALSEPFFRSPPAGFTDVPLLQPRGALAVAGPGLESELDSVLALSTVADPIIEMPPGEAIEMAPFLRAKCVTRAVFEAGVTDIEVAALLQSYLKGFKASGGQLVAKEPVTSLQKQGVWTVTTGKNSYLAKTIINAAGAWADDVGAMAGATRIGLVAKRRTAIIVEATPGYAVSALPCVDFAGSDAYVKPDAGKLMVSPGDATPSVAQDAQPDEMDVAVLVDWLERETLIKVRRILHSWAGLRSFVADQSPVVGYDPNVRDFVWHAGQGGYGIMMAPALAVAIAAICGVQQLSKDPEGLWGQLSALGPDRLL